MEPIDRTWVFVISLVAVINGLGIVRLLTGLSDYLKNHTTLKTLNIQHYWVYTLLIVFQLLIHLLLWWSLIGLYKVGNLNFLSYLYLLIGPSLLYLGTSILIPDTKIDSINLRSEYYSIRKTYYSILSAFYLWVVFIWPVFGHSFAPTAPLVCIFLLIALTLRVTDQPKIHAALIIANYAVYITFIIMFVIHLSELGQKIAEH